MNLTYTRPGELRKPDVEVLPDGRIRITRYIAAGHGDRDLSEVNTSVGTADNGLATALLVRKGMARVEGKDAIVLTYEVRNASTETKVGLDDVQYGENGLKTITGDWVQMSSGTYVPQTVGTSTSTYDATCVLRQEIMEDDGTTRQIRRIYVNKGLINQVDEVRNNGALLLKTLVYLNDSPSPNPPSGYTLISTRVDNPGGLETTTFTFAKGDGLIEKNEETRLSGMLLRTTLTYLTDPSVTTQPTTDPFGGGGTVVGKDVRDADGHRVWTVTWVKAVNTSNIIESKETRSGGKLIIYTRQRLGSTPATPSATIGGVVTLISDRTELQDGYTLFSRTWAEGVGQIGQDDETRNNGKLLIRVIRYLTDGSVTTNPITTPVGYVNVSASYAEQDGYKLWTASYAQGSGQVSQDDETRNNGKLLIRTIRQLSAPSVSTNPITTPVGYVLVSSSYAEQDGHKVWTGSYASGSGQISQQDDTRNNGYLLLRTIRHLTDPSTSVSPISTPSGYSLISTAYEDASGYRVWTGSFAKGDGVINSGTELRNKGKLVIYKTTKLGSAPTTPTATIGGTVVLIDSNTRQQDGYTLYDYTWAEGVGTISYNYEFRIGATLVLHTATALAVPPSTPSAIIAGTIVNTGQRSREESGVTIYDYEWIESVGNTVSLDVRAREDGSVVYAISVVSPTQATPAYPGSGTGYLVDDSYERNNGFYTNKATYIKLPADYNYPKQVSFTVPGLLTAANPPVLSPPVNRNLMGTAYVTYSTSQTTDVPYTVTSYAILSIAYTRADDGKAYGEVKGYDGYLGSSSYSAINTNLNGVLCTTIAISVYNSVPTGLPSGVTVLGVDCEKYLTTTTGTTIWRNVSVKYTF